jgi:hypothetical protein
LGVVIALNSVTIGLETDSVAHAVATQEEHDDRLWYIVELIFCPLDLLDWWEPNEPNPQKPSAKRSRLMWRRLGSCCSCGMLLFDVDPW